jgi:hypothetical protein
MNITKRLTRDKSYIKPAKTFQESMTNAQIKEALKDYKKVSNILTVPLNSHVRYFTIDKDSNKVFRLGGSLTKFGTNNQYVILSNGTLSWSVQIGNSQFFQKMSENELKEEMKADLKKELMTELQSEINIGELKMQGGSNILEENKELKKENKILLKKIEHLNEKMKYIESEILKEKSRKNKK